MTCLARGDSGDVPPGVELIRTDRLAPGAYDDAVGEWDEVIELAYEPGLVGPALEALAHRARALDVGVDRVSVYASNSIRTPTRRPSWSSPST